MKTNYFILILLTIITLLVSCSSSKDNNKPEDKNKYEDKPKPIKGWTMMWNDEFNNNKLDDTKWSKIDRGSSDWNNYMSKADTCYEIKNGKLILKGFKNNFLPEDKAKYLTGGICTKNKKTFTHGKIIIKAKLNPAQGAWPAFWMLPEKGKWPDGGEIDIMERLNYENSVYQTVHSYYTVKLGIKNNPPHSKKSIIKTNDFNTYSVEIYEDKLVFNVNDIYSFTYNKIETNKKGQFPFGKPFYLLLDMQLGGKWVGSINDSDLPVEMEIDWVRFYTKNKNNK